MTNSLCAQAYLTNKVNSTKLIQFSSIQFAIVRCFCLVVFDQGCCNKIPVLLLCQLSVSMNRIQFHDALCTLDLLWRSGIIHSLWCIDIMVYWHYGVGSGLNVVKGFVVLLCIESYHITDGHVKGHKSIPIIPII